MDKARTLVGGDSKDRHLASKTCTTYSNGSLSEHGARNPRENRITFKQK